MADKGGVTQSISERTRWEFAVFYFCIVLGIASFALGYYFPAFGFFVQGTWAFLFIAITIAAAWSVVPAVYAEWLNGSPVGMSGNRKWTMSHREPIPLGSEAFDKIDRSAIEPELTEEQRRELQKALSTTPGTNARGNAVKIEGISLGGGDRWGFHSIERFTGGIAIVRGSWQYIRTGSNYFWLHPLQKRHQSEFSKEVLKQLQDGDIGRELRAQNPTFYEPGPLDPAVRKAVEESPELESIKLQAMGFDGMARRFAEELRAEIKAIPQLVDDKDFPKYARAFFQQWLQRQPNLVTAMGEDWAGLEYYRSSKFALQTTVHQLDAELTQARQARYAAEQGINARVTRKGGLAGGGRAGEPFRDNLNRTPAAPSEP